MDIKFNFIKEKLDDGLLKLFHINTDRQVAHTFTKPIAKAKFETFVKELGLIEYNC